MNKQLQNLVSFVLCAAIMVFCGIGVQKTYERTVERFDQVSVTTSIQAVDLQSANDSAEFISGPLVADVGELCVFRLNDPGTKADWIIVPPATCYIDSSGSSLVFASNVPSKYSIVAAIVEDGVAKILTHVCEYGLQPQPDPGPRPEPEPKPNPPPITTLKDWVTQNVPDAGKQDSAALASCYESAAQGIEDGSIRTQEAAFSVIRTATQTKIDTETWASFLDALSEKITEKLAGSKDVKTLGAIFREIAEGLRIWPETGDGWPENDSHILYKNNINIGRELLLQSPASCLTPNL